MGIHTYKTFNGPMVTTAAQAGVSTGTTIKTMLQLATPSTRLIRLISWGYSVEASIATGPNVIELLQTDVAATVTAHVASGVQQQDPNAPNSLLTLGTAATGYTATAEGAIAATRMFDAMAITPGTGSAPRLDYEYQWMPDERPIVAVSKFVRVRCTFATAATIRCWIVHEE